MMGLGKYQPNTKDTKFVLR